MLVLDSEPSRLSLTTSFLLSVSMIDNDDSVTIPESLRGVHMVCSAHKRPGLHTSAKHSVSTCLDSGEEQAESLRGNYIFSLLRRPFVTVILV